MRRRILMIIAVAVTSTAAWVGMALSTSREQLKLCGHPDPFSDRFQRFFPIRGSTHCCKAGGMVSDLRQIALAVEFYRMDHNGYPAALDQVTNDMRLKPFAYAFTGDGKRWSISVAKQEFLPGHYRMTSEGGIHFNKDQPATLHDVNLWNR